MADGNCTYIWRRVKEMVRWLKVVGLCHKVFCQSAYIYRVQRYCIIT